MVKVKNISKVYDNGKGIFDISFTLEKNKIYGLLGENGAGKSTLLNLLTGYIAPTGSSATFNSVPNGQGKKVALLLKKYNLVYLTLCI